MRSRQWFPQLLGLVLISSVAMAGNSNVEQGHVIYVEFCASCHGSLAEGDGPMARALLSPPSNLRLLSERYGNPLPEDEIARFIDGRANVKAHGPRDMPVWGEAAWANAEGKGSQSQVRSWVAKVVAYLQSLQKSEQNASSKLEIPPYLTRRSYLMVARQ